jgi:hypothetical protein
MVQTNGFELMDNVRFRSEVLDVGSGISVFPEGVLAPASWTVMVLPISQENLMTSELIDDLRVLAGGIEGLVWHPVQCPDIHIVHHKSWTSVGPSVSAIMDIVLPHQRMYRLHTRVLPSLAKGQILQSCN